MFTQGKFSSSNQSTLQIALDFLELWNNDELFIEVKTSGSTGVPQKISLLKSQMLISANKTNKFFDFNENTRALLCLSTETIAGIMMLVRAIAGNYSLRIEKPTSNPLKDIDSSYDFMAIVPLQLDEILNTSPEKLMIIQTIIVGGAPVSDSGCQKLKSLSKTIYQTFGMTETISHVALRKIGFDENIYFKALPGVTFEIANNQLIIHYPELFTAPLLTNDLVKLIDESQFEWLGRADFVINSGGVKIFPEKIEFKLSSLIPCPFFIASIPDERLGEKIVLVIENDLDLNVAKVDFIDLLEKFEIPKLFAIIPKFERTTSAKINRNKTLSTITFNDWKPIL